MKRKCDGCKALEVDRYYGRCLLGHSIKNERINDLIIVYKPLEECPKPMTNIQFIEAPRKGWEVKNGNDN
jgi:hypothetical protein